MDKEKMEKFEKVARPLIAYLNENHHPHTKILITPDSAEIVEGVMFFPTSDYLRD